MLRRIFATAILAGALAGLFVSALQGGRLIPLIHEAEVYEDAGRAAMAGHDHATAAGAGDESQAAGAVSGDEGWMPREGFERVGFTVIANILAATGFALLLAACFALKGDIDAKRGVIWGLAGFAVFHLAPAFGLPPEPPGGQAAALHDRQMWWLLTAAATAGGLALVVFVRGYLAKAAGAALIVLPHALGAPAPLGPPAAPAELAVSFAIASLATAAVFWAFLGGLSGYFFRRLAP